MLWVKPVKIDCKWYRVDSTVTISNSRYGAEWAGETSSSGGSLSWVDDSDYNYVSSPSFGTLYTNVIKSIPNSGYVNCSVVYGHVAFQQKDTLSRGGSSWTFQSQYVFQY